MIKSYEYELDDERLTDVKVQLVEVLLYCLLTMVGVFEETKNECGFLLQERSYPRTAATKMAAFKK